MDNKSSLAQQIAQAASQQAEADANTPKPLTAPAPEPSFDPTGPKDPARLYRWLALLGGGMADAITTKQSLAAGAREANPLMRPFASSDPLLFGSKLGINALLGLLADKMHKSGYTGEANALGFGMGGLQGGMAFQNVLTKQDQQKMNGGSGG